jgi:hypothetical protein
MIATPEAATMPATAVRYVTNTRQTRIVAGF